MDRQEWQEKVENVNDQDLCYLIYDALQIYKKETDAVIKNWQKYRLSQCIVSYSVQYFTLCRNQLNDFLEPSENITEYPKYLKSNEDFNDNSLENEIKKLCGK